MSTSNTTTQLHYSIPHVTKTVVCTAFLQVATEFLYATPTRELPIDPSCPGMHSVQCAVRINTLYIRSYMHTYMHTYIHTCIHAYMHTYKHPYIHTHTHAYLALSIGGVQKRKHLQRASRICIQSHDVFVVTIND